MELDFLVQLNRFINTQSLFAKSVLGVLGATDSMSIMAMPGGAETVFFDGTRDKSYQVQINAKSNRQDYCINALNTLSQTLERLTDLPSANGSYDFESITVTSLPSFLTQDESGYFIYELSISAKITIYQGVI